MNQYEFAKAFASIMHLGQRYGTNPYDFHLEQVEKTLLSFGFHAEYLLAAAWLHDVVEDTPITHGMVKHGFDERIADIVYAVTNEYGRNRKERHAKTYPKVKANKDALIVKLADRIANAESARDSGSDLFAMYAKEWLEFHDTLFDPSETDSRVLEMWECLRVIFECGKEQA